MNEIEMRQCLSPGILAVERKGPSLRPRSSRNARHRNIRWQAYALAALVLFAILLGGGGTEGYFNNGLIQGASAVLIALLFASNAHGSWPFPRSAAGVTWVFGALLLIVLLQLAPTPPSVWQALPGRDLAVSALSLIGASQEWRPLSVDPDATRRFAASLLLPAAILYGMLGATRREAVLVVRAVVLAAGISALIGCIQLTLGSPSWVTFYEGPNPGAASGVFANANHHATLLAGAILCLALLIRADRSRRGAEQGRGGFPFHTAWLAIPFFIVLTLATGSRAGLVLLFVAVPGALLIAIGGRSPLLWFGGIAAAVLVAAAIAIFSPSGNAIAVGQSYLLSEDSRYSFLPDVLYTLRQYWPAGSGFGTFVQVFAPNENLDVAGAGYINRAHNDLLEWLLEAGLAGAIWLAAVAVLVLWRIVGVARARDQMRGSQFAAVLAGALVLLVVALHSLVDYPVRVAAIAALTAVAGGLLFTPFTDAPPRPLSARRGRLLFPVAAFAGLVVGALALRIFAAEAAIRNDNGKLALTLRPDNGRALALVAEEHLENKNKDLARQLAAASIERAPLNASAVRMLAMVTPNAEAAGPAWRLASAMGWRDRRTQLWAFQQALANGEFELAAVRADAFMRTHTSTADEFLSVFRTAANDPRFRVDLAKRLALRPYWRDNFFVVPSSASDLEVAGAYQILMTLAAADAKPTLGESRSTIYRLIQRKQFDRAIQLHRAIRGDGPHGLLDDGSFNRPTEDYRANSTPLDWFLLPVSGGTATIEEQRGRYLFVETDGSDQRSLLRRYVPLEPGTYRLEYTRRGEAASPEAITVAIRCADGQLIAASSTEDLPRSGGERRYIDFTVGPNCPMIMIGFEAKAVGRPAAAEFDDFSLRRL